MEAKALNELGEYNKSVLAFSFLYNNSEAKSKYNVKFLNSEGKDTAINSELEQQVKRE